MSALTTDQIEQFRCDGYLIFERFFTDDECADLKSDIDRLEQLRRDKRPKPLIYEFPHLGPLISHPRVMATVEDLLGPGFAFHHLHAVRQDEGTPAVNWHQDYEQFPQTDRTYAMVHLFYYFNGLNGEIGDLLLVPRSQQTVLANNALWFLGTEDLPGMRVCDTLPPGAAVLVHSALWHARRAKPGGANHPRYFADASYCQAGIRWPSHGGRHWRELLNRAVELGLDRGGKHSHLFDAGQFFDQDAAETLIRSKPGSLALELRDWQEEP